MGTVYRAQDPAMGRVVAVKTIISVVLESQQGGEFRERFYREARAAGALAHPGIVAVFDGGQQERGPFLGNSVLIARPPDRLVKKGHPPGPGRNFPIQPQTTPAL